MALMMVTTITMVLSVTMIVALEYYHDFARVEASGELVTYWGQNSNNTTLAELCQTSLYNIVVISYLDLSGGGGGGGGGVLSRQYPYLNLDLHCNSSNGGCTSLTTDIAICQSLNVRVLLSISGGGGRSNHEDNEETSPHGEGPDYVASYLWNNFLSGESDDPGGRPLGAAILDGIDLDIESGAGNSGTMNYYGHLAQFVRQLSIGSAILTASPRCLFPDPNLGPELSGSALESSTFDYVWVRFYNNSLCQFDGSRPTDLSPMLGAWEQWTQALPEVRILLGIPASPNDSISGFIPSSTLLSDILPLLQGSSNYGGIMLHTSYDDSNSTYAYSIKPLL